MLEVIFEQDTSRCEGDLRRGFLGIAWRTVIKAACNNDWAEFVRCTHSMSYFGGAVQVWDAVQSSTSWINQLWKSALLHFKGQHECMHAVSRLYINCLNLLLWFVDQRAWNEIHHCDRVDGHHSDKIHAIRTRFNCGYDSAYAAYRPCLNNE